MEAKCIFCRLSLDGCPCSKVDTFFGSVKHIPSGGKPPMTPPVPLHPCLVIPITRAHEIKSNVNTKNK